MNEQIIIDLLTHMKVALALIVIFLGGLVVQVSRLIGMLHSGLATRSGSAPRERPEAPEDFPASRS